MPNLEIERMKAEQKLLREQKKVMKEKPVTSYVIWGIILIILGLSLLVFVVGLIPLIIGIVLLVAASKNKHLNAEIYARRLEENAQRIKEFASQRVSDETESESPRTWR